MYRHHTEYYLKGGDFYLLVSLKHSLTKADTNLLLTRQKIYFSVYILFFSSESLHTLETSSMSLGIRVWDFRKDPLSCWTMWSPRSSPPFCGYSITRKPFITPASLIFTDYSCNWSQYSDYSTSVERLIMILKTSHRYGFPVIKALALRELEKKDSLPVIDRILLYKKNGIDIEYLVPWFAQLCSRNSFLTRDEYNLLGVEGSYIVSLVRERARGYHSCGLIHHTSCCEDLKKTIAELLKPNGDVYDCLGGWVTWPFLFFVCLLTKFCLL